MEEVYGTFNNNRNGKKVGALQTKSNNILYKWADEGAIMKGNTWLIPDNAIKPEDPRRTRKNSDEIEEGAK